MSIQIVILWSVVILREQRVRYITKYISYDTCGLYVSN